MKREIWQCLEGFGVVTTGEGDALGFCGWRLGMLANVWYVDGPTWKNDPAHSVSHVLADPSSLWLALGNWERVKCQVQNHKTGASARDIRMLPFPGGGGESSWHICPSESKAGVSGPLRGWRVPLVSQPLIFPSRCCLGTPEKWVDDAVILNEPNTVIKQNLGAFNYQRISILQMGKRHFTYHSRGLRKKGLFLPRIKRILWHRELIVLQYIFIREIIG